MLPIVRNAHSGNIYLPAYTIHTYPSPAHPSQLSLTIFITIIIIITMDIRILDHNGTPQNISARMTTDLHSELRRIGEPPSPHALTVNLWITNQTPDELLKTLKRIPGRRSDQDTATQEPHSPITTPPEDRNPASSSTATTAAPLSPSHDDNGAAATQADRDPGSENAPPKSLFAEAMEELERPGRAFNSVYQRETGHIFADPYDSRRGELVGLEDGRIVNLRVEWEKEMKKERERERERDEEKKQQ